MKKVFILPPGENWIVDRFTKEWYEENQDISVTNPFEADVIWLLAPWCWRQLPPQLLQNKQVITTIHHIVPEKFDQNKLLDFMQRDSITDIYHVPNQRTFDFIKQLTQKPIYLIPYWANNFIWKKTHFGGRKKFGLPYNDETFIIGSWQRDTEGFDLKTPKFEKGPDLFVDAIEKFNKCYPKLLVLLGGWRRQYIINRFEKIGIQYKYIELPSQETINEMYQVLDLYLVTARHEGGPQALIECGLLDIPCRSRPVGIAEQVLPPEAIHDDVTQAVSCVPNVNDQKLPAGFESYRSLIINC